MTKQKSKRERQQELFHVGGVFVFLTIVALFFILGLGDEADATVVTEQSQEGMNYELPDPDDLYRSGSKLEAVQKEQVRLNRENSQRVAQNTSFDMLNSLAAPKEAAPEPLDVENLLSKIEDEPDDFMEEERRIAAPAKSRGSRSVSSPKVEQERSVEMDWVDRELEKTQIDAAKRRLSVGLATHEDSLLLGLFPKSAPVVSSPAPVCELNRSQSSSSRRFTSVDFAQKKSASGDVLAVIHGAHRNVKSSDQVRIRLCQSVEIGNVTIPANTIIFGTTTFGDTRIDVKINNIEYNNNIYAFNGTVYDTDGGRGLYTGCNLVNATIREAAGDSYNRSKSGGTVWGSFSNVVDRVTDKISEARQNAARKDRVDLPIDHKIIIKLD